jgi:probable addiction module antidote protein
VATRQLRIKILKSTDAQPFTQGLPSMTQAQLPANSKSGKLTRYDVVDHLRSPEEMAAYLDAWFEEFPDDVSGIARAVGDIARAKGMTQVAQDAGLSRESLYRALSEEGNPSLATILKVLGAVGLKLSVGVAPRNR